LQSKYIGYFNNLRTARHISEDNYNVVEKEIEKLKKGVVEDVYRFKLTEEGYKKLMLALEMIKGHGLEIYAPVEPTISTVTSVSAIEEVGKNSQMG